ncbi:thioesterase II family protein [Streptomyces sp. NPDC006711]|uniref:thioesterase II family protein n=1 Tax=Streptomyces sp. NPDC006711 TaxID=3364762 RepID=UPI0036A38BC6
MHSPASPSWLIAGQSRPGAPKLYCFAHAGGSATEYIRWGRSVTDTELHAVQLPGRGSRFREPMFPTMQALVAAFLEEVPLSPQPYAFFGHSLGSLVAYEITRALRDAGRPLPARLILSGCPAPHLPRARVSGPVHQLSDDALIERVASMHGGIPQEVLDSQELRELIVGALRADYRVLETYTWQEAEPLPVPLTILGGSADHTPEQLNGWQSHTSAPLTVRQFPGGHFYLRTDPDPVLRALAEAVRTVQAPATA